MEGMLAAKGITYPQKREALGPLRRAQDSDISLNPCSLEKHRASCINSKRKLTGIMTHRKKPLRDVE